MKNPANKLAPCLHYVHLQDGTPPMRPLWYEFPEDSGSWEREGSHMVGAALLVAPVLTKVGNTIVTRREIKLSHRGIYNCHTAGKLFS